MCCRKQFVHVIFPTNKPRSEKHVELQSELIQFDDFIVGDYLDTYGNLTLKTFSGYKFINEYCSSIVDLEGSINNTED